MISIAHRGAMGYAPENTLLSFEKALELGAKHIELDVFLVDGELIVFHDDRVERLSNGKGYIWNHSFQEIRKLDLAMGQKIPTLDEVLQSINGRAAVNIELKGMDSAQAVARLLDKTLESNSNWKVEHFLISSFRHKELLRFAQCSPQVALGLLLVCSPLDITAMCGSLDIRSLHMSLEFITSDLVSLAHTLNLKVYAFTVNELEDIQRMADMGVDGVFCNYPDRAIDASYRAQTNWL